MKIEKTPSGKWRVRYQENGQRVCATFDHKPTQSEMRNKIYSKIKQAPSRSNTEGFYTAATSYIDLKRNVLSPRTVREYGLYINRLPNWFTQMSMSDMAQIDVQRCVNELAAKLSPKTVRTLHGFISAVLGMFRPDLKLNTTLPQKVRTEPYIPTDEDVRTIVQHCRDVAPHFYVPLMLACFGLRRSEIFAVKASDLDGNMLTISRALVQDESGEWVEKATKTELSTRSIVIPPDVADLIREQGYAYHGGPQCINQWLRRTQDKLHMQHFSLHKLRHYFASRLSAEGVPDADIMALGGWSTDAVMKTVYRHAMSAKTKEGKEAIARLLSDTISDTIS